MVDEFGCVGVVVDAKAEAVGFYERRASARSPTARAGWGIGQSRRQCSRSWERSREPRCDWSGSLRVDTLQVACEETKGGRQQVKKAHSQAVYGRVQSRRSPAGPWRGPEFGGRRPQLGFDPLGFGSMGHVRSGKFGGCRSGNSGGVVHRPACDSNSRRQTLGSVGTSGWVSTLFPV